MFDPNHEDDEVVARREHLLKLAQHRAYAEQLRREKLIWKRRAKEDDRDRP